MHTKLGILLVVFLVFAQPSLGYEAQGRIHVPAPNTANEVGTAHAWTNGRRIDSSISSSYHSFIHLLINSLM
jgi:hypothetical protein